MRKLKFRAWDKRNNKWFHQDLFYVSNAGFYSDFRELDDGNSLFDYEYELMQYTGLKDKNGREIFEGDILDYKWKVSTRDLLIVEWSERDACFLMGGVRTDYAIAYGEVIGNIHENPELLGDIR